MKRAMKRAANTGPIVTFRENPIQSPCAPACHSFTMPIVKMDHSAGGPITIGYLCSNCGAGIFPPIPDSISGRQL